MATKTAESKDDCKYPMDTVGGNEIITLGIGQCGVYIANEFYSRVMNESKINRDGKFEGNLNNKTDRLLITKSNAHFISDGANNRYIPRAIFCDIDCGPIDKMRTSYLGSLLATDSFLSSPKSIASMIWAQGHYTEGAEYIDEFWDKMRNNIEICDHLQGFQVMHGISGGVGGGFGTLLLLNLRDKYPQCKRFAFTVYPSRYFYEERNTNLVSYNTVLSIHQMIETADLCFIINNGKLLNGLKNKIGLNNGTMDDINWLISLILSGITAPFRFHCEPNLNSNLKTMNNYFTCFPRLHFLALAASPFISTKINEYDININKILNELLFVNDISDIRLEDGKILNLAVHYKSNDENAMNKMDQFIYGQQSKYKSDFVGWIPQNFQSCYVYDGNNFCYKQYSPIIATTINHTSSIKTVYQRISSNFNKVYKRKGYLHWYKGEGMDEMEFQEADKNLRDLVQEYQDKQDVYFDDNHDDDDGRVTNDNDQKYQGDNDDDF